MLVLIRRPAHPRQWKEGMEERFRAFSERHVCLATDGLTANADVAVLDRDYRVLMTVTYRR